MEKRRLGARKCEGVKTNGRVRQIVCLVCSYVIVGLNESNYSYFFLSSFRLQYKSFNLATPMGLDRCHITRWYLTFTASHGECALIRYFHFIIKTLGFFNYHRLSHGFSFRRRCCVSHNTVCNCTDLGHYSVLLERPLYTFTCAIIVISLSVSLYNRQLIIQCCIKP
jgi:hypothetical protein